MTSRLTAWALAMALLLTASPLWAQARVEVSLGGGLFGATTFREVDASQFTPTGGQRALFRTASRLRPAPALWARAGLRIVPRVMVEGAVTLTRPALTTEVRSDAEAGAAELTTSMSRYAFEGGVLADLARWRRGRVRPFAAAGAGYLRQVSEGRLLVETGLSYYAGGGLHYLLRDGARRRVQSAGLRIDARAVAVERSLSLDGTTHVSPAAGVSLFIRF